MLALSLLLARFRDSDQVTFVHFLAPKRLILAHGQAHQVGAWPGRLEIWDLAKGRWVRRSSVPVADVLGGAVSSDGKTIALGGQDRGPVEVREVDSGRLLRRLDTAEQNWTFPRYAFAGRRGLATIRSATMTEYGHLEATVLPIPTGDPQKLVGSDGGYDVAADREGKWLAVPVAIETGAPDSFERHFRSRLHIYDLPTGALEQALPMPDDVSVPSLAFSGDGRRLAARQQDGKLRLWDTGSWEVVRSFQTQPTWQRGFGSAEGLAFSSDGRLLIALLDWVHLEIFDLEGKRPPKTFQPSGRRFWRSVSLSPNGRTLAIGGMDGVVEMLDIESGRTRDIETLNPLLLRSMARASGGGGGRGRRFRAGCEVRLLGTGEESGSLPLLVGWAGVGVRQPISSPTLGTGPPVGRPGAG